MFENGREHLKAKFRSVVVATCSYCEADTKVVDILRIVLGRNVSGDKSKKGFVPDKYFFQVSPLLVENLSLMFHSY